MDFTIQNGIYRLAQPESMHLPSFFAIYGQPGVPMDFWLLTLFHVLVAVPVHIIVFRARSTDGYTSLFSKDGYVVKDV